MILQHTKRTKTNFITKESLMKFEVCTTCKISIDYYRPKRNSEFNK